MEPDPASLQIANKVVRMVANMHNHMLRRGIQVEERPTHRVGRLGYIQNRAALGLVCLALTRTADTRECKAREWPVRIATKVVGGVNH